MVFLWNENVDVVIFRFITQAIYRVHHPLASSTSALHKLTDLLLARLQSRELLQAETEVTLSSSSFIRAESL